MLGIIFLKMEMYNEAVQNGAFFQRDTITITTSMVIEDPPLNNDNKVNASPVKSNKTFGC
jgi:hypothetical protein